MVSPGHGWAGLTMAVVRGGAAGAERRWGMAFQTAAATNDPPAQAVCWGCGTSYPEPEIVRLGQHHEVGVCLGCAHFLHQRARAREDAARPSPATCARHVLRTARELVIRRGWHTWPLIGPVLRRLGSRLP